MELRIADCGLWIAVALSWLFQSAIRIYNRFDRGQLRTQHLGFSLNLGEPGLVFCFASRYSPSDC